MEISIYLAPFLCMAYWNNVWNIAMLKIWSHVLLINLCKDKHATLLLELLYI